jgi:hypothetical protein
MTTGLRSNYPGLDPVLRQLRWSALYFAGFVFVKRVRNFVAIKNCPMRECVFGKGLGEFPGNRFLFIWLRLPRLPERLAGFCGNQYDDGSRFSGRTLRSSYLDVNIIGSHNHTKLRRFCFSAKRNQALLKPNESLALKNAPEFLNL